MKTKTSVICAMMILLSVGNLKAQEILTFDTIDFENVNIVGAIFFSDLESCERDTLSPYTSFTAFGMTKASNNNIYAFGPNILPNFPTGLWCTPPEGNIGYIQTTIPEDPFIQGMSCDYDGLVYLVGQGVSIFDPVTEDLEYIGNFPPGMLAGGDLTYREGHFYMTTTENELVKVDIENPVNSQIIHTFPDSLDLIQGLATFPFRCDSTDTYAITQHAGGSTVYYLDFDDFTLQEHCQYERYNFDAATTEECILPPCEMFVDLDLHQSQIDTMYNFELTTCLDSFLITGEEVLVFSPYRLDSMKVTLTGVLDIGEEILVADAVSNLQVVGNNTTELSLINTGNATEEDFELLIRNIKYQNVATSRTLGVRNISFTMYSSFYSSVSSSSTIELADDFLTLEPLLNMPSCYGEADGFVELSATGGNTPYGFIWPDGSTEAERSDLAADEYLITITDAQACSNADTLVLGQPDSLSTLIIALQDSVCGANGTLIAQVVGGTMPFSYSWNNIAGTDTLTSVTSGNYTLELTDANGCMAFAEYQQAGTALIETMEQQSLCEGNVFAWEMHEVSTDTTICTTYTISEGCDSVHCITIQVLDNTEVGEIQQICEGETFNFNGLIISEAGTYRDTSNIPNELGCDSIIVLTLTATLVPAIQIDVNGDLCLDEQVELSVTSIGNLSYEWSDGSTDAQTIIEDPGMYYLTVTNAQGCQTIDSMEIMGSEIQFSWNFAKADCENTGGEIVFVDVIGGTPPYVYSLDGTNFVANPAFEGLAAGVYTLLVEDSEGCRAEAIFELEQQIPIEISGIQSVYEVDAGTSFNVTLQANQTNIQIQWSPTDYLTCDSCLSANITPWADIDYQIEAITDEGCLWQGMIIVKVNRHEDLYIPNAFSPNDDGFNDLFEVYFNQNFQEVRQIMIFSRWGGLVFESEGTPWNGNWQGKAAPEGVYVYQIITHDLLGREKLSTGEILLIR